MAYMYLKRTFITTVTNNSSETDDYTPANGEHIILRQVYGYADFTGYTRTEIIWDEGGVGEESVFLSYGSTSQVISDKEFIGDGTKKLRIKLTNDYSEDVRFGGAWEGETI